MTRVGVHELRHQARALLRRVESGERFEITCRGRPVAMLGDLPAPLPLSPGQEAPSSVLARLRRDER
jgi:prevent-host-death family protein